MRELGARVQLAVATKEPRDGIEEMDVDQLLTNFSTFIDAEDRFCDGDMTIASGAGGQGENDNAEKPLNATIVGVEAPPDAEPRVIARISTASRK